MFDKDIGIAIQAVYERDWFWSNEHCTSSQNNSLRPIYDQEK